MAKKLSKILWHDTKVDGAGKPVLPSVATDDKGLNGLLPGELFMHVGKEKVSLWALSLSGEVVEVSGKAGEVDIDLSDYLLKSVWDSVFEIKTDVSGQKYIFGKLPVVTKYGITMYADDGNVDIPQLAEGLPYDQRTIWFNPETKQIEVIGGTGGGEGGVSNFWDLSGIPSWITNSKPIYNYSEINGTPDLSVFVTGTALSNTLADYATLSYLTSELKKYVTLDGAQDIKGVKNFVNGLKIGGLPITKKQDDVVYLDANLVVRGGITMYAENEVDIPSILDSLPIANANTQDKASKGIASFDSAYFKVTDGWVTLTSAPSSGASYLGKLQNVDDSIDATASVDRILYQPQGSSVWTWRELPKDGAVGDYLPLSGGTITNSTSSNLLVVKSTGTFNDWKTPIQVLTPDIQAGGHVNIEVGKASSARNVVWFGLKYYGNSSYENLLTMGLHSVDDALVINGYGNVGIGTTSPQAKLSLENGNIDIYNTSGDWGGAMGFNRKSQLGGLYNSAFHGHQIQNYKGDLQFYIEKTDNTWLYPLVIQGSSGNVGIGTTSPSCKLHVNSTNNQVVGIVSSNKYEASIIYTNGAGNLWVAGTGAGKPGDYYGIWSNTLQYSPLVCSYEGAVIVDQITYIAGGSIGFNRNTKYGGRFNTSYNGWQFHIDKSNSRFYVYTEGTNSGLKAYWDTSGNYLVYGGITMYSDQRKKTILNHVELSLKQIADAPLIEHYYNSDQDKTTHVGSIAQYWASMNDWFCKLDNEGYYTMEIQNCALASAISIARHLEKYETKTDKTIRKMKQRIKELEDKLERLEGGKYGCN